MPTAATINDLVNALLTAQTVAATTITLTASSYNVSNSTVPRDSRFGTGTLVSGLPHITKDVTINVSGSFLATITRTGAKYRHFYVAPTAKLTINNLILTNGDVDTLDTGGGAIFSEGTLLTVRNSKLFNNKSNYGGAILNGKGQADILNCDIYQNQADWGGGLYNGGVANGCVMNITDTRIASNAANEGFQQGGGITNYGTVTLQHCMITGNTAVYGGGIVNKASDAQLTIRKSHLTLNSASGAGGGIHNEAGATLIECSTLIDNVAPAGSNGSQAYRVAGTFTVTKTSLPDTVDNYTVSHPDLLNGITVSAGNALPGWKPNFIMGTGPVNSLVPVYQYNRAEAAAFAIKLSRANFNGNLATYDPVNHNGAFPIDAPGVANVVGKISRGVASTPRIYTPVLNHITGGGKTGSAIFPSEAIHYGGIPMTIDAGDNVANPDCTTIDQDTVGAFSARGWRACPPENSSTRNWKDHLGIITYFPSLPGGSFIANLSFGTDITNAINTIDGTLKTGATADAARTAIISKFAPPSGVLRTVAVGDYVYIGSHGFFVVGWGPFYGTIDAINWAYSLYSTGTPLPAARTSTYTVPYVVDFCYGTDSTTDAGTGWLQDPRPRPIYTTVTQVRAPAPAGGAPLRADQSLFLRKIDSFGTGVLVPTYQPFTGFANWGFYKIPDTVSLTNVPISRMYFCG